MRSRLLQRRPGRILPHSASQICAKLSTVRKRTFAVATAAAQVVRPPQRELNCADTVLTNSHERLKNLRIHDFFSLSAGSGEFKIVHACVQESQLGTRDFPVFVHPQSGRKILITSESDLKLMMRQCNAVWIHLAGRPGHSVRFDEMLPGVEYGAVSALVRLEPLVTNYAERMFLGFRASACL